VAAGVRRVVVGYTLVELLVGVLVSGIVITAAVQVLLSIIRSDVASQRELNRRDDVSRALALLQEETRNAVRVRTGTSAAPLQPLDSSLCPTAVSTLLILDGITSNRSISYGLQSISDVNWRGPRVLVRCGPLYNDQGQLIAGTPEAPQRSEQVVLDSLCTSSSSGCANSDGFTVTSQGGEANRSIDLTLNSLASGRHFVYNTQVSVNSNQVFQCPPSGCLQPPSGDATYHRPALGGQVSGDYGKDDIVYFDGPRADYVISGAAGQGRCTITRCDVSKSGQTVVIEYGDVLVFSDGEIRLPN